MGKYADALLGGDEVAEAPPSTTKYADALLGSAVSTTPAGAVTSIQGRANLTPRKMTKEGHRIEDYKDQIANYDAGPTDDSTARMSTLTKAAFVDDPETKLRIFAKARFPKDPNAFKNYGVFDDGEVFYKDGGKFYRETPAGAMGWLKEAAAGTVGKAPPLVGGVVGTVGSLPTGPGAIAGGAMGAAGGEGVRKIIGGVAFDEPATTGGVLKSMALEGAFSAGGTLIGRGAIGILNRGAARDISRLDRGAVDDLTRKAEDIGVELNPAQKTNLPSVKGKFEALARMPESADTIEAGMKSQAEQANRAAYRFLQQVSQREGMEEIGEQGVGAAGKVISMVAKERADAARPLYKKAFDTAVDLSPEATPALAAIIETPAMKEALKRAVVLAKNEGINLADPGQKMLGLHYAKLALDDAIENAGRNATGSTFKRGLVGVKEKLLGVMDELSPDYAEARKVFAHFSPSVEAIKSGTVARIADLPAEKYQEAARLMFKPGASPKAVEEARALFTKAGLQDDYNGLLRSYLQETFEQAGRQYKSGGGMVGQAPAWRAAMLGDPSQARVLKAAMDSRQWQAFTDMSDVFEAMGRVSGKGNSITMPMQEAAAGLRRESGAGAIATAITPQRIPGRIADWFAEARLGKHADKMAEIMTSPDGMKRLRELAKLEPGSEKMIQGAASLFGVSLAPTRKSDDETE